MKDNMTSDKCESPLTSPDRSTKKEEVFIKQEPTETDVECDPCYDPLDDSCIIEDTQTEKKTKNEAYNGKNSLEMQESKNPMSIASHATEKSVNSSTRVESLSGCHSHDIKVPSEMLYLIVGGEHIRKIENKAGCKLEVASQDCGGLQQQEKVITVTGSRKAINRAKDMIRCIMQQSGLGSTCDINVGGDMLSRSDTSHVRSEGINHGGYQVLAGSSQDYSDKSHQSFPAKRCEVFQPCQSHPHDPSIPLDSNPKKEYEDMNLKEELAQLRKDAQELQPNIHMMETAISSITRIQQSILLKLKTFEKSAQLKQVNKSAAKIPVCIVKPFNVTPSPQGKHFIPLVAAPRRTFLEPDDIQKLDLIFRCEPFASLKRKKKLALDFNVEEIVIMNFFRSRLRQMRFYSDKKRQSEEEDDWERGVREFTEEYTYEDGVFQYRASDEDEDAEDEVHNIRTHSTRTTSSDNSSNEEINSDISSPPEGVDSEGEPSNEELGTVSSEGEPSDEELGIASSENEPSDEEFGTVSSENEPSDEELGTENEPSDEELGTVSSENEPTHENSGDKSGSKNDRGSIDECSSKDFRQTIDKDPGPSKSHSKSTFQVPSLKIDESPCSVPPPLSVTTVGMALSSSQIHGSPLQSLKQLNEKSVSGSLTCATTSRMLSSSQPVSIKEKKIDDVDMNSGSVSLNSVVSSLNNSSNTNVNEVLLTNSLKSSVLPLNSLVTQDVLLNKDLNKLVSEHSTAVLATPMEVCSTSLISCSHPSVLSPLTQVAQPTTTKNDVSKSTSSSNVTENILSDISTSFKNENEKIDDKNCMTSHKDLSMSSVASAPTSVSDNQQDFDGQTDITEVNKSKSHFSTVVHNEAGNYLIENKAGPSELTTLQPASNPEFKTKTLRKRSTVTSRKLQSVAKRMKTGNEDSKSCDVQNQNLSCDECGSRYSSHDELRTHIESHMYRYSCDNCEAKFSTRSNRNKHMNEVHGEK